MKIRSGILLLGAAFWLLAVTAGCQPTYPRTKIKESIIRVCKSEYKIDVKVVAIGKTIAIYLPLPDLLDYTFAITKAAGEKINNVILSVSRVALSTDAQFDFYVIIAHDVRLPEIQIVIIKSVDDVKRLLLNDISRGEYSNRMLVDIRMNPQAQKEHSIKEVFDKMNLDKKWQDQVMNDFFRSEPTGLGDIGYWNGRFYVKDISMAEFLAEQVANRVKIECRDDKKLAESLILKSSKGVYRPRARNRYFQFEVLAEPKSTEQQNSGKAARTVFQLVLKTASGVIHSYNFSDFGYIEVVNLLDGQKLRVSRDEMEAFRKNKMKIDDILLKTI